MPQLTLATEDSFPLSANFDLFSDRGGEQIGEEGHTWVSVCGANASNGSVTSSRMLGFSFESGSSDGNCRQGLQSTYENSADPCV